MKSWIHKKGNQTILKLYVQPGAKKNEILGEYNERLKVKIQALPVDGAANKELIAFLSKTLKLSKKEIMILRGDSSRMKDVLLDASMSDVIEKINWTTKINKS